MSNNSNKNCRSKTLRALQIVSIAIMLFLIVFIFTITVNAKTNQRTAGIATAIANATTRMTEVKVEETIEVSSGYMTGYTTANMNVRDIPSIKGGIIGSVPFNEEIQYYMINNEGYDWCVIEYDDEIGYIRGDYISDIKSDNYKIYVYNQNGFKSYMSYRTITSTGSQQYRLQYGYAYTGNYGIRMIGNRYCIAVGTGVGATVGTLIDLILENGTVIPCVVGDIKANIHTNVDNITTTSNGCVSEFIVDSYYLPSSIRQSGNVSNANMMWQSPVVEMDVYYENVL